MYGMSNSSVVPRIKYVNNSDPELLVTNISTPSKNRITISILLLMFSLYGLVIAWKQEAHKKRKTCNSAVWKVERWWFMNKNSISILRMRNDAETILKSRVPLVPFLNCPWNDSTKMYRACHLRNSKHETHFLNSFVGYRMRRIVGKRMNMTNTQPGIAANMANSGVW